MKAWEEQDTVCSRPQNRQGTVNSTRLGLNSTSSSDLPQGHLMWAGAAARENRSRSTITDCMQWGQM